MSSKSFDPDTSVTALICLVRAMNKAKLLPLDEFKSQLAMAAAALNELGDAEKSDDLFRLITKLFAFEEPGAGIASH